MTMKNTCKVLAATMIAAIVASSCNSFPPKGDWGVEAFIDGSQPGDTLAVSYLKKNGDLTATADTLIVFTGESQKIQLSQPFVEPSSVVLFYNPKDTLIEPYYVDLFINNAGDFIKIVTKAADYSVTKTTGGMYDEPSYDTLRKLTDKFMSLRNQYMDAIEKSDTSALMDVSVKMGEVQRDYFTSALGYVKSNPSKGYSAYILADMMEYLPADTVKAIFNSFPGNIKSTSYGKRISAGLDAVSAGKVEEGSMAPDFGLTDTQGREFNLSNYRGKWVLLDFWGSWCGPCRKSNPSLVKLYDKYKNKGFHIIGLAVNDKEENLAKAIKEDGITWRNANLSQNQNGSILPTIYGIKGVPSKFLIDPEGKIVLIEVGYDESAPDPLAERLAEIFK